MYAKGIQLYCAPTADDRETWLATMRHIALEGRCFVLSCNQFARRSRLSRRLSDALGRRPETVLSRGGSCIVGPLGEVLADFGGETILTADLDLATSPARGIDFDVVGHYARPDVFQLTVDESSRTPVTFHSGQRPPGALPSPRDVDRRAGARPPGR